MKRIAYATILLSVLLASGASMASGLIRKESHNYGEFSSHHILLDGVTVYHWFESHK